MTWSLVNVFVKSSFLSNLPFEVLESYGVSQKTQEVLEGSALFIIAKQLLLLGLQNTGRIY